MFETNVSLKRHSHYKIGGEARYFFEAKKADDLIKAAERWRKMKLKDIFILAGGSNTLISDEGFNGLVIKPNLKYLDRDNLEIRVASGVLLNDLLHFALDNNLSGLEWAAGVPGTVGGTIYGNAGAFGMEIKDIIESVASLDISRKEPKIKIRNNQDCEFDYRSSIFKKQSSGGSGAKEIIIEARIILKKGDTREMKEEMERNIDYRLKNHPLEYPSLGCVFKNVKVVNSREAEKFRPIIKNDPFPIIPAAWLIAEAELKGVSAGGAMISPKHPNFIVNVLEATADDVKNLIQLAKNKVKKKFGIDLKEEIEYLL